MNSIKICKDLYDELKENQIQGNIHSVFHNSFNIITKKDKLITIIGPDKSMNPNSIKVDTRKSFKEFNFQQGDDLVFNKEHIHIQVQSHPININYKHASIWDSGPVLNFTRDSLNNIMIKLNMMGHFLHLKGNNDGILPLLGSKEEPLSKELEFIKDRFFDFIFDFKNQKTENLGLKAQRIIGFGAGLTPSMDDFLSGIMIANIYSSYYLCQDINKALTINKEIIKNVYNKTTKVSESMLELTSIGKVSEDIRNLLVHFFSHEGNSKYIHLLQNIIDFGHSSGTDTLCGIYIGIYINLQNN